MFLMIKCIAIDDQPLALKQISGYIEKTPYLELVGSFTRAILAQDFLKKNQVDLMFVDIDMPDLSGIDFVKSLSLSAKVIFTTAYREYAFEGFKVDAADYLVKPINYTKFLKSADKVKKRYFSTNETSEAIHADDQFLFLKSEHRIIRINFNNIKYIEGMRDYVRIHLDNQKPVMALMVIKKLMENLPKNDFMRVHRSYIVNLKKIETIERNRIVFDNDRYIPVSKQYSEEFQSFLDNNFLK